MQASSTVGTMRVYVDLNQLGTGVDEYLRDVHNAIGWAEKYGFAGMLIFQANDVYIEPWVQGQLVLSKSRALLPLIAVNPVYMHPFTVAKKIATMGHLYGRPVALNLITGTALSFLFGLNDELSHDQRYDRLLEYSRLVLMLLEGRPVTFEGEYYVVRKLTLSPALPRHLMPSLLLAGQSAAAVRVARELGAVTMQMLPGQEDADLRGASGIATGLIARDSDDEAWEAARRRFPDDAQRQQILELSMLNSDSEWKRRNKLAAERTADARPGYWMGPFKNFRADMPYFVGSHRRVAAMIAGALRQGVRSFIVNLPAAEEEFAHASEALRLAVGESESIAPVAEPIGLRAE